MKKRRRLGGFGVPQGAEERTEAKARGGILDAPRAPKSKKNHHIQKSRMTSWNMTKTPFYTPARKRGGGSCSGAFGTPNSTFNYKSNVKLNPPADANQWDLAISHNEVCDWGTPWRDPGGGTPGGYAASSS